MEVLNFGSEYLPAPWFPTAAQAGARWRYDPRLSLIHIFTGVSVYNQGSGNFEFKPGGVFANLVIGDEINRASPKTQSALLEAMEERRVSADGVTHELPRPFLVLSLIHI